PSLELTQFALELGFLCNRKPQIVSQPPGFAHAPLAALHSHPTPPQTDQTSAERTELPTPSLSLGRMFWLWWKTFSGPYVVFARTNRSERESPSASRTRSGSSSPPRKLTYTPSRKRPRAAKNSLVQAVSRSPKSSPGRHTASRVIACDAWRFPNAVPPSATRLPAPFRWNRATYDRGDEQENACSAITSMRSSRSSGRWVDFQ